MLVVYVFPAVLPDHVPAAAKRRGDVVVIVLSPQVVPSEVPELLEQLLTKDEISGETQWHT